MMKKSKLAVSILLILMATMIAIPSLAAAWKCESCSCTTYNQSWYTYSTDSWACDTTPGCRVNYKYRMKVAKCTKCGAHDFTMVFAREETYSHSVAGCGGAK